MNGFQLIDPGLSLFENLFLPTLAWSVVVGFVFIFIHLLFAENPRFQTQIRILLLWTLPAAIFINFILNTQFVQSKPDFIVIPDNILILNTDTIEPVPAEIAEPSPDIYEQIKAITGWISGLTILIGFSYFTGYLLLFHRLARYHQYLILIPENEVIKLILLENDLNSKVTVYQSNGFVTPFTFGFSHPKIIIPEKYCSDPVQFQLILRHEVSHIRNHDYLKQMCEQALKFLFFWNPLLHLLTRQISNYREMACDVQVLSVCPDWKKEYATLLLTHLSEPAASTGVAAAMSHSTENLKERISKMKTYQTIKENKIATGVLAGAVTAFSITFILLVSNAKLEAVENGAAGQELGAEPDSLNRDYPELVGGMDAIVDMQKKIKYPEFASRKGIEGLVVLSLKVSEKGEIEDISVEKSTGSPALDAQAVVAAQDLKFKPAIKDGKAVAAEFKFPVKFKLNYDMAEPVIVSTIADLSKQVIYPKEALEQGIGGVVVLNVMVDETGKPEKITVEKSVHPLLDQAAIDAAKKTRFMPSQKDGKNIQGNLVIPIQFMPKSDKPESKKSEDSSPLGTEPPQIKGGFGELMKNLVYPEGALKKGIEGTVLLNVDVSESGDPINIEIEKSAHPFLDMAAQEAVFKTKFIPGRKDGKPVAEKVTIPIKFKIPDNQKSGKYEENLPGDGHVEIEGGFQELYKKIVYPASAIKDSVQGVVLVSAIISEKGEPTKITILKPVHPDIDKVAYDAVLKSKFIPAKKNGKPVEAEITIPIKFKLN